MRRVFTFLCLIFAFATAAKAAMLIQPTQAGSQATYRHIPANTETLVCSDPFQQADCKVYFAGFAHTLDLIFATDQRGDAGDGLCGDISDLVYEFMHEVQTNPKARDEETHTVLAKVLIRDHSCAKLNGQPRIQNNVMAGNLIDLCHAGNRGLDSCSQYEAGFLSAVLFASEATGKPLLCGDQRLINPLSVSEMLNEVLLANFRLRRNPAVEVMFDELKVNMVCPNK